jgi:hypothetical protein
MNVLCYNGGKLFSVRLMHICRINEVKHINITFKELER